VHVASMVDEENSRLLFNYLIFWNSLIRKIGGLVPGLVEKPKKERRLPELLSLTELKKFFKTVQKCGDTQHELMLKLMLYTAVRVSELVNIQVKDIDLGGCKIFIDNGKGSKDRYILFPTDFRLALQTYIDAIQETSSYLSRG
jgi:site-specific recombinase XerD